jgi:lipopolysaccharide export system ATP-binding protein
MGLTISNLKKRYRDGLVVKDLSLSVGKGEIVGLLGPNGAGKTTAFYMIIGLIAPDSGSVVFNDVDITALPIHKRAEMGMGYLSQEPSIFRQMSVEENILAILEMLPMTKQERSARLESLLAELGLSHLATKPAVTLSGGERRRLEITRALVTNPSLLLLDEPFANIDPITIRDVKEMIHLLKKKGISVLITDHNAREVATLVDRCYLMQGGVVASCGTMEELLRDGAARESYFGEDFTL